MLDTSEVDHLPAMRYAVGQAAALLKSLANEDRLLILCQLCAGECCVSELEALVDVRQPTLSQQLAVLRSESLVATRREGRHIFYRIEDKRALLVINVLHQMFCEPEEKT